MQSHDVTQTIFPQLLSLSFCLQILLRNTLSNPHCLANIEYSELAVKKNNDTN